RLVVLLARLPEEGLQVVGHLEPARLRGVECAELVVCDLYAGRGELRELFDDGLAHVRRALVAGELLDDEAAHLEGEARGRPPLRLWLCDFFFCHRPITL